MQFFILLVIIPLSDTVVCIAVLEIARFMTPKSEPNLNEDKVNTKKSTTGNLSHFTECLSKETSEIGGSCHQKSA